MSKMTAFELNHQSERDRTELDMDEYQELAASTAIYPRVYTEAQIKPILTRAYLRTRALDTR